MDTDERRDILELALAHLTEAGELVRSVGDPFLDAYVLPQLEGQEAGWLGEHGIEHVRAALTVALEDDGVDA